MSKNERKRKQRELPLDAAPQGSPSPVEIVGDPSLPVPPEKPADSRTGIVKWFVKMAGGPAEARRLLDMYIAMEFGQLVSDQPPQVTVAVPLALAGYGRATVPGNLYQPHACGCSHPSSGVG